MLVRLLIWFLVALSASAQQYPFLPIPGSPEAISKLFQDSSGRLWLMGAETFCFDGTRFFSLREYGLPSVTSLDVAEDGSGAIWIGANTGVYRFAQGRVEQIGTGSASSLIAISPDTIVGVIGPIGLMFPESANSMLVRFQRAGKQWKAETVMKLNAAGPLTLDHQGSILFPLPTLAWKEFSALDLLRWHSGAALAIKEQLWPGALHTPIGGALKVLRDRYGCLWFGASAGEGGNEFSCHESLSAAPLARGTRPSANFHEGEDGKMVLWGNSLLAVGRFGQFRVATPMNGLPGLTDAIPASDGTVWLASSTGLYRFASPFQLEYWTPRDGVSSPPWSLTRSRGQIYAGGEQVIRMLAPDRQRWQTAKSFQTGGSVMSLLTLPDQSMLASFMSGGIVRIGEGGKVLAHTSSDSPEISMRLLQTPEREVWAGGNSLASLALHGDSIKLDDHRLQTLPSSNVLTIKYEPQTHALWSCYNGGAIVRDKQGEWREFTKKDGLLGNGCWSLVPLPNGDVWYAYYDVPALSLLRPNEHGRITVRSYVASDELPEPGGSTLELDQHRRLWRGGNRGVYVADAAQAEAATWLLMNEADGFPANGMNTGSYFSDPNGSLWWGADNDLVHYTPSLDLVTPMFAPKIFVSALSWNGLSPKLAEAVQELPHASTVTAYVGTLQYDRRNALRVRYRIRPEEAGWRESRSLNLALGVLGSGEHTLEVQGRIFTGPWSGTVRHPIRVLHPVWMGAPYLWSYAAALLAMVIGFEFLRRRRAWEERTLLPSLGEWRMSALAAEGHELTGTTLDDRFEVKTVMAQGGFATVLEGFDRHEDRRCAIKVFRGEVSNKAATLRGFEQEVAALRQIRHPNVVAIYAHGVSSMGSPYVAMEFIEGKTLRDILKDGSLDKLRVGRLLEQLAGALDAIHARGICHRDVKPENVIVREDKAGEVAMLVDFSIAIIKDVNETMRGISRAAGTFDYMAPEQALGYAEPSSDVFSLAKVLIEMLSGVKLSELLPNQALDLSESVPELLSKLGLRLSTESERMVARALEFDPKMRPSMATEFAWPIVRDLRMSA